MNYSQNDTWIVKYKNAGLSDKDIAARLNTTPAEIRKRWLEMLQDAKQAVVNGHANLVAQFSILSHQYMLLGESLKIIGNALANEVPSAELQACLEAQHQIPPEEALAIARDLLKSHIVLRPFMGPIDPQESFEEFQRRTTQGN